MTNKHIERASWDENIEEYPSTSTGEALAITTIAIIAAWGAIEVIDYVLDGGLINWVAGWF